MSAPDPAPRPLRQVAGDHLARGRKRRRHAPAGAELACTVHEVPAGRRCALCADQLDLFELPEVTP